MYRVLSYANIYHATPACMFTAAQLSWLLPGKFRACLVHIFLVYYSCVYC